MGRRLKQPELVHLLAQAQQRLWEQRAAYPLPSVELDREQYLALNWRSCYEPQSVTVAHSNFEVK